MTSPGPHGLIRVRTSDQVADHILGLLFAGRLRAGDRIDLDSLAAELGVSRVPVREALAQLERDGIASRPHHRGAFVSAFDTGTVQEAFELYALLSGLMTFRVARHRDEQVIEALTKLSHAIARTRDLDRFEQLARDFRRVINLAAGGPHLRALMRTFRGLVPAAARFGMAEAMPREREYVAAELDAIRRGEAAVAAETVIEHIRYSGQCAIDGLVRAGIFPSADPDSQPPESQLPAGELLLLIESSQP
jgi:DNA-binding GntR family transcriptional regulator